MTPVSSRPMKFSHTSLHPSHILRVANPGLANSCIQGMLSSSADVRDRCEPCSALSPPPRTSAPT